MILLQNSLRKDRLLLTLMKQEGFHRSIQIHPGSRPVKRPVFLADHISEKQSLRKLAEWDRLAEIEPLDEIHPCPPGKTVLVTGLDAFRNDLKAHGMAETDDLGNDLP